MIPCKPLQQLHDLNRASPQFHDQLSNFLRGNEYRNGFPNLQSEDSAWLVEYLDSVLVGISDPASLTFQESLHELGNICSTKELLPKSCVLSDSPLDLSFPSASGCVYEGTLGGSRVCIKRVRLYPEGDPQKVRETFHRVAVVWKHLAHPNVVPLLGVTIYPPQLISDWMSGGSLREYIAGNSDADRLSLLSDVAEGLNYLHYCNVIHGDLKGTDVLVDTTGRARITDFGLAMATQNLDSIRGASAECGDNPRWIAPEILGGGGTYSKESDIFSFAMVMIEAFTGAVPFSDKPPRAAILAIMGGERPPRPAQPTLTDGLWALIQRCWDQEVRLRPKALEVLQILHGFGPPTWERLISRPLVTRECIPLITSIFSDKKEVEVVQNLRGDDAQAFIDVIDELLDALAPWLWRKCLSTLRKICGRQALLPKSVQIPLCYYRSNTPLYRGGYADVWKGEHQGRHVAIKVLRVYSTDDFVKIKSRFCKEVVTWKTLHHPNVLPLTGVTMDNYQFTMVSEWMADGNINEFIKVHRDVNRFELLKDIARGLIYMHGQAMIHGDLKGANILIDKNGHACLADFGLLTIISDHTNPTVSSSSANAGTTRWMSPELLDPDQFGSEKSRRTKKSDCYALGMVILEVLSGQAPFPRYSGLVVMRKVIEGERPGRPQGPEEVWFTDGLWETLGQCWSPQPKDRPAIESILGCLEQVSVTWQPLPPSVDCDVGTCSDDELSFTGSGTITKPLIPPSQSLDVASKDYSDCIGDFEGQHIDPQSARSNQDGLQPHILAPSSQTPILNELPAAAPLKAHGCKQTCPNFSQVVSEALAKIAAEGETQLSSLSAITAQLGDGSPDIELDVEEAEILVETLDKLVWEIWQDKAVRDCCLRILSEVCRTNVVLPRSYTVPNVVKGGKWKIGRFADIWTGKLGTGDVCIKAFRMHEARKQARINGAFYYHIIGWKCVSHPNVLPLLGVSDVLPPFCLVSPRMPNGDIIEYTGKHWNANRLLLLTNAVCGLEYLHSLDIIHGGVNPGNILITAEGVACIGSFGITGVTTDLLVMEQRGTTAFRHGVLRYMAPEQVNPSKFGLENSNAIKATDVHCFAMTAYRVLIGTKPYHEIERLGQLVSNIIGNTRPSRPEGEAAARLLPNEIWEVMESCWTLDPSLRPSIYEIYRVFLSSVEKADDPTPKGGETRAPLRRGFLDQLGKEGGKDK